MRSGNESRYPAVIALRNVDIGGNPSDPCMKTILSIEVNCCRLALMSWMFCSVGLSKSVTYIPVVLHRLATRTGLSL